jgi:hypothetical protein
MARKKLVFLTAALLSAAMLWGCGSSGSGGAEVLVPGPEDIQPVGITNCAQCHSRTNAAWLEGTHGNPDASPSIGVANLPNCVRCHNLNRDGELMPAAYGVTARGVVSCETCHGGGSAHRGIGPLPRPAPDFTVCAACHNETIPHSTTDIAGDFFQSAHAAGGAVAARESLGARCSMCHSDEGFRQYAPNHARQGGYEYIGMAFAGEPDRVDWSVVQCRTCHDSHTTDLRVAATLDDADEAIFSQQFNLCTSCHQVFVTADGRLDPAVYGTNIADLDPGRLEYHHPLANIRGSLTAIISDTHFPGLFPTFVRDAEGNNRYAGHVLRTGFGIDPSAADACTQCHDAHSTMFTFGAF